MPSYYLGEVGILLVLWRMKGSGAAADRLYASIRSNIGNPTREALWAAPGTMLAAWHLWEATGEERTMTTRRGARLDTSRVHDRRGLSAGKGVAGARHRHHHVADLAGPDQGHLALDPFLADIPGPAYDQQRHGAEQHEEQTLGETARRGPVPPAAPAEPGPRGLVASFLGDMWAELKSLVRIERLDRPDPSVLSPGNAFFLRENLKLRLLNARLALLSRQFDTAQSDLRDAQSALDRYFDRSSRRVVAASETVRQVMGQSRLVNTPRPDATLAAIAAAAAGR